MMKVPREFLVQFGKWQRDYRAAIQAMVSNKDDLAAAWAYQSATRVQLMEFRRLYGRWRPRLRDPQKIAILDQLNRDQTRLLERIFFQQLIGVIRSHQRRVGSGLALEKLAWLNEELRDATPERRAELIAEHLEAFGGELDPENDRPKWEERRIKSEAEEPEMMAKLAAEWPERVDQALLDRIAAVDMEAAEKWVDELHARNNAPD